MSARKDSSGSNSSDEFQGALLEQISSKKRTAEKNKIAEMINNLTIPEYLQKVRKIDEEYEESLRKKIKWQDLEKKRSKQLNETESVNEAEKNPAPKALLIRETKNKKAMKKADLTKSSKRKIKPPSKRLSQVVQEKADSQSADIPEMAPESPSPSYFQHKPSTSSHLKYNCVDLYQIRSTMRSNASSSGHFQGFKSSAPSSSKAEQLSHRSQDTTTQSASVTSKPQDSSNHSSAPVTLQPEQSQIQSVPSKSQFVPVIVKSECSIETLKPDPLQPTHIHSESPTCTIPAPLSTQSVSIPQTSAPPFSHSDSLSKTSGSSLSESEALAYKFQPPQTQSSPSHTQSIPCTLSSSAEDIQHSSGQYTLSFGTSAPSIGQSLSQKQSSPAQTPFLPNISSLPGGSQLSLSQPPSSILTINPSLSHSRVLTLKFQPSQEQSPLSQNQYIPCILSSLPEKTQHSPAPLLTPATSLGQSAAVTLTLQPPQTQSPPIQILSLPQVTSLPGNLEHSLSPSTTTITTLPTHSRAVTLKPQTSQIQYQTYIISLLPGNTQQLPSKSSTLPDLSALSHGDYQQLINHSQHLRNHLVQSLNLSTPFSDPPKIYPPPVYRYQHPSNRFVSSVGGTAGLPEEFMDTAGIPRSYEMRGIGHQGTNFDYPQTMMYETHPSRILPSFGQEWPQPPAYYTPQYAEGVFQGTPLYSGPNMPQILPFNSFQQFEPSTYVMPQYIASSSLEESGPRFSNFTRSAPDQYPQYIYSDLLDINDEANLLGVQLL